MKKNDEYVFIQTQKPYTRGMTLRDYFAGQAISGILYDDLCDNAKEIAKEAYDIADAMLEEREKQT